MPVQAMHGSVVSGKFYRNHMKLALCCPAMTFPALLVTVYIQLPTPPVSKPVFFLRMAILSLLPQLLLKKRVLEDCNINL